MDWRIGASCNLVLLAILDFGFQSSRALPKLADPSFTMSGSPSSLTRRSSCECIALNFDIGLFPPLLHCRSLCHSLLCRYGNCPAPKLLHCHQVRSSAMSDLPIATNNGSPSPEKNSSALEDNQQGHEAGATVDKEANADPAPSPRQVHGIAV